MGSKPTGAVAEGSLSTWRLDSYPLPHSLHTTGPGACMSTLSCAWAGSAALSLPQGGGGETGGWLPIGPGRRGRQATLMTLALWDYTQLLKLPVRDNVAPLTGAAAVAFAIDAGNLASL